MNPRSSWIDQAAYDAQAAKLAAMFHENFKNFSEELPEAVIAAGPVT